MISARGGEATLGLGTAKPAFRGSKRNGIESHDHGEYRGSYHFQGVRSTPTSGAALEPKTYKDTQGVTVQFAIGDAAFADRVVAFEEGTPRTNHEGYRNPQAALGPPRGDQDNECITLGCGGRLILEFTNNVLVDGPGPDLHTFEVGPDVEAMQLEISVDGRT